MKRLLILFALCAGAALAQTPTITAVLNNYGRIPASASNYGIAQGSLFIVKGANLSALPDTVLQSTPLQTTLANVRVRITVNGVITYAPIYYVLSTQIAAVLPSNIAVSNSATVIIEKPNNVISAPFTFKVVTSAYGQLAWESEMGTGRAIVVKINGTLAGNNGTDTSNVLNPNEVIILYGSGLGPIATSDALAPTPSNMANIAITITIGGVNAEVQYRGRSTFAALDQINVKIPVLAANAYSCNVAMLITVGGVEANPTTLPIAATGTTCTNPNTGGGDGGSTNPTILTQSQINEILARGTYRVGNVSAFRTTAHTNIVGQANTTRLQSTFGSFNSMSGPDLQKLITQAVPPGWAIPAHGVCQVYDGLAPPVGAPLVTTTSLDAGASLSLQYPPGTAVMPRSVTQGSINYEATLNSTPGGRYTFSGIGGPQGGVGAFTLGVDVAAELLWANRTSINDVTRASGVTVTWTGGEPGTLVSISGTSSNVTLQGQILSSKGFICYANQSAGQFNVPGSVLTQIPATTTIDLGVPGIPPTVLSPGSLSLSNTGKIAVGTASGMDVIIASGTTTISSTVTYK